MTRVSYFFRMIALMVSIQSYAQQQNIFPAKTYPAHAFKNPLSIPFSLVGNFGECRPDHFHSGIDIRTNTKENLEVFAIEDGYIARVKIEAGGFGNAIYINHLSGYTSVYAHLNKFFPELEAYVRQKQYANKSWNLDISFFPYQFKVRKGSFIAWSGNTGSSQGPHVHLEVRDAKTESPLNPLLFFDEIIDDKKPIIKQLAVYDGSTSIFEQSPILYTLNKGKLKKDTLLVNTNKVFLGFHADDFLPAGVGTLGIYEMRLFVDEKLFLAWQLDNISYDVTRYVNALADYKTKKKLGIWIQLCRKLPNNKLSVYKSYDAGDGIIDLADGNPKNVRIEVYDTKYNTSSLSFTIQSRSASVNKNCEQEMLAGKINHFKNQYIAFTLNQDALYDHICFKTEVRNSNNPYSYSYQIHDNSIPLHSYFDLMLTPKKIIPDSLKNKIAMVKTSKQGIAAKLLQNKVVASVREFGTYEIVIDQKAPVISSKVKDGMIIANSKALYFNIKEETTSVKTCTASVDGQWLRLVQKGSMYYYEMDEYFPTGTHTFTITATDENDNQTTQSYTLTR